MDLNKFKKKKKYLMLALDHRGSFKKIVNSQDKEILISRKKQLIENLSDMFSGVLIDPVFGLAAIKMTKNKKDYLLCTEKSGYTDSLGERLTEIEYTIGKLKEMGASAIKLLVYFNPFLKSSEKQLEVARKVLSDCKKNNLPLFFEIVTYGKDRGKNLVIESVKYFLDNDFRPDVFKLEYAGGNKDCQKISQMLGDIEWILLTRGADFPLFCKQLESACKDGGAGFLAGRPVWQDLIKEDLDKEKIKVLRQRFEKINKIATEK